MPKVATLIRSYGLTNYLKPVIRQYEWVDKILIMNYRFMNVVPREDKTVEIAKSLGLSNIEIESGELTDLHQTINQGVEKLRDYDFIFISDADELITHEDQQRMIDELGQNEAGKCTVIDYARDFDHIFPIRSHEPITIIKPTARFFDVRCVSCPAKTIIGAKVHHFGYVYNPEEMEWKVNWERPWEHDTVIKLLAQIPQPYEMPKEIRDRLNA